MGVSGLARALASAIAQSRAMTKVSRYLAAHCRRDRECESLRVVIIRSRPKVAERRYFDGAVLTKHYRERKAIGGQPGAGRRWHE